MLGRRKGKRKGFTLGEMLLVIVILASIIIFSVPAIFKSMEGARKKSFVMQARKIVNLAMTKRQEDDILNKTEATGQPIMKDGQVEYYCYTFSSVGLEKSGKFKGTVAYYPKIKKWKIKIGDGAFETKDGYITLEEMIEVDGEYLNLVPRASTDEQLDAC